MTHADVTFEIRVVDDAVRMTVHTLPRVLDKYDLSNETLRQVDPSLYDIAHRFRVFIARGVPQAVIEDLKQLGSRVPTGSD